MRSLPRHAQLYLIEIYLLGIIAAVCARSFSLVSDSVETWELVLFLALGALAGSKKFNLTYQQGTEGLGDLSLGFALTFAALLRFGPAVAFVVGLLSALTGSLFPRRQPIHLFAFNVALAAIQTWTAGIVFLAINGWTLALRPVETFTAVMAATTVYFALNTLSVAVLIGLSTQQKPFPLWRESFLWTAPGYFAGASISALAIILFGRQAITILLFIAPVAYLTLQSYALYTARMEEKQQHVEEMQLKQAQLAESYLATIKSLALAIDAKDQYTHQHILRVQRYAVTTAEKLGLTGDDMAGLNTGALLHDIGKLGVPEYVLLKPGRLTPEEFDKIKKHPEIGAAILAPVEFPWPVLPVVKYHHEKWDGTGYPEGLKGEEIPLTARVLAVADVYDALTSSRSYRSALSHQEALTIIRQSAGSHFDPRVVEAFLSVIEEIVAQMAEEGQGPLASQTVERSGEMLSPRELALNGANQAARDIQRASSELWALYEVAQTLSSSLGLQETIDILARKLEAILPGTACLFLLRVEHEETLLVRAAVGVNRDYFYESHTISSTSRSVTVARHRRSYLGTFDPDDLLLDNAPAGRWQTLQSALIVPIIHEGEVLGTINLYHPQENAFSQENLQFLETIADRVAPAIHKGLLFDRARSSAFIDPLTGLYNARYLTRYIEEQCKKSGMEEPVKETVPGADAPAPEMSESPYGPVGVAAKQVAVRSVILRLCQRTVEPFALLCLDLDGFRSINEHFGHQKGDQALRDLGKLLRRMARENDVAARHGGDEFTIVLRGVGWNEAKAVAARIQTAIESYDPELSHPQLGTVRLSVSIGIACFPNDAQDCASLLAAADAHLHTIKAQRPRGPFVARELVAAPVRELSQGEDLRLAA